MPELTQAVNDIIRKGQNMPSVEMGKFPSASTPGKYYTVSKDKAGTVWCQCWAWKKMRTCSHKKAVEFQIAKAKEPFSGTPIPTIAVADRKLTIQEAIDRAVAEMRGNQ